MDLGSARRPGRSKVPEKSTDCECPTCPPIIKSLQAEQNLKTGGKLKIKDENSCEVGRVSVRGQGQNNAQVILETWGREVALGERSVLLFRRASSQ